MQHIHDCDECISLGEFEKFDLYYHPGKHWTLIGRYGPDGDYQSSPEKSGSPCLIEARKRAVERGLMAMGDGH
ncbi:MAG: hypothetical protein RSD49_16345 [Hafnia sp.]